MPSKSSPVFSSSCSVSSFSPIGGGDGDAGEGEWIAAVAAVPEAAGEEAEAPRLVLSREVPRHPREAPDRRRRRAAGLRQVHAGPLASPCPPLFHQNLSVLTIYFLNRF